MNPQSQICPNPDCSARGQVGQGNIRVHSQQEGRYRCTTCGRTFAATTGLDPVRRTPDTLGATSPEHQEVPN